MSFIYAILILLAVITIHEFGHFIAAKLCGVKVYEFAIGMGPKIYERQGKETLFSIRALPLGGFCRLDMIEEEQEEEIEHKYTADDSILFEDAGAIKKIIILISGVLMNLLTAVLVLLFLFQTNGYPSTKIRDIVDNSLAETLDIKPGDRIIKIDSKKVQSAHQLMSSAEYRSGEYDLTIIRDGQELLKHVKTEDGKVGIYFDVEKDFLMSTKLSFATIHLFVKEILRSVGMIFTGNSKNLMSVVGFVATVGQIPAITLDMILMIVVNISISLAVFNLLPIVPLDGGHIVIVAIEGIIGKKLDDRVKYFITMIGIIFILYIFTRSLLNDFTRF